MDNVTVSAKLTPMDVRTVPDIWPYILFGCATLVHYSYADFPHDLYDQFIHILLDRSRVFITLVLKPLSMCMYHSCAEASSTI
jgi:hypothetical protein